MISSAKVIGWISALLAAIAGLFGLHRAGRTSGKNEARAEAAEKGVQHATERAKIDDAVRRGGDAAERLRDEWSRD